MIASLPDLSPEKTSVFAQKRGSFLTLVATCKMHQNGAFLAEQVFPLQINHLAIKNLVKNHDELEMLWWTNIEVQVKSLR